MRAGWVLKFPFGSVVNVLNVCVYIALCVCVRVWLGHGWLDGLAGFCVLGVGLVEMGQGKHVL